MYRQGVYKSKNLLSAAEQCCIHEIKEDEYETSRFSRSGEKKEVQMRCILQQRRCVMTSRRCCFLTGGMQNKGEGQT